MLDPNFIRKQPDRLKEIIKNKGTNPDKANVDRWLELDALRTDLAKQLEEVNRRRNEIADTMSGGNVTEELRAEGKALKQKEQEYRTELDRVERERDAIGTWFPNIPFDDITIGRDDKDNPEIFAWRPDTGEIAKDKLGIGYDAAKYMPEKLLHADKEFAPKHHMDIVTDLKLADFAQGAKASGTRFVYLMGDLVRLQRAVHEYMLAKLLNQGFTLFHPPLLVKEQVLYGTSHFPEGRDQVYEVKSDFLEEKEPLFLVGSSEPSNFAYGMDRVFKAEELPLKMVAITPCFRSEVGSWGKDVKGLKRIHQFEKLEMDIICKRDESDDIYNELLNINHWLLQTLKIPYHVVEKCTGDSGYAAAARQADPEAWLTGQQEFMEVGTDTNATDFQARRFNMFYIDKDGEKKLCHTVNDTGAPDRILIAIIDNYQQSDGTVLIPEVLQAYMGKKFIGK
jgi:seryl-tRNA synthetase